jgi:histone H3/H4
MKRILKKMLLQYHPDKISSWREGKDAIEGTNEEVESYLKDITQELARMMHTYGGD